MISGENLESLSRFLPYIEKGETRNGMVHLIAENVPTGVVTPVLRAVMRREARLLAQDADAMEDGEWEPRNQVQRRADAFADVLVSLAAALRYSRRD